MLQWLRLAIWLLLSAAVSGRDVQCDEVSDGNYCWNSQTQRYVHCWGCIIKNQQISDNEFNSIAAEHANGTAVDVKFVTFIGGDVTKLPKVIKDSSSKHYFKVQLVGTKTRLINAQFFELAAQHLTTFGSEQIDNLSVAADAFRNCAALEYLNLGESGISSIPRDAFLGLHKLIRLDLHDNKLTDINENLLVELVNLEVLHLQHNQLADIPDAAFDQLQKLKWLYLQENKIEIVRRRWFQNNQQLLTINLEYNQIKVIQSGSFARIFKLSWLSLEGNKCTNRDFDSENSKEISEALTGCLPKTCLIPVILNGHIVNAEDNATQIVGDSSEEYNPVKVVCNQHYSLFHEGANQTENQCQNEVWIDEKWAECHQDCPHKQISGLTISTTCKRHGKIFPCSGHLLPGTKATIRCQIGYQKLEGPISSELTCQEDGKWNLQAFQCQPISGSVPQSGVKCPHQLISGLTINAFCNRNGKELNCTGDQLPGTEAIIECHFGYQMPPTAADAQLTCLTTGEWSHEAFKCEPICGKVTEHSTALLIGSKILNVTEAPWHVGIYQNGEQICGGTIVSERVVISAAHCFSREINFAHTFDVKDFQVAAGKYKRSLNAGETLEKQIRDVVEVKISMRYDGYISYKADIATIIIAHHFEYQPHIAPACLQFVESESEKYPKRGAYALVAGWGENKAKTSSETLQAFNIPVEDWATCQAQAPVDIKTKVIEDKICAGFVDRYKVDSMLACKGDSGGGLLVPQMVAGERRYFLQGVVSNSRRTNTCDDTFYTLFTNVQFYKNFLNEGIEKGAAPWVEMVTQPPVKVTSPVTSPVTASMTETVMLKRTVTVTVMPPVTQPPVVVDKTWHRKAVDFLFKNLF